jgi:RNA polymerase sigma-70 factor (ECF subfamily)
MTRRAQRENSSDWDETTRSLLQRAKHGDDAAVEALFRRSLPALQRWAAGRLPPAARDLVETQDLVQETLVRTFKRVEVFDAPGPGAFGAYLRRALINRVRDEIRRVRRRPEHALVDSNIAADGGTPLDRAIDAETRRRYTDALQRLRDHERRAVMLRIEAGATYEEIAAAIGKPTAGAARKIVERSLLKLAVVMNRGESRQS